MILLRMWVLSGSVVSDSFTTPWTHQDPLSMGSLQARILEWVAMPSFRASSQHKDRTQVSHIAGRVLTEPPAKPTDTEVGSLSLL